LLSTPDDLSLVISGHSFVFSGRAVAPADDLRAGMARAKGHSFKAALMAIGCAEFAANQP
jgi:hypothetical protein